MGPGVNFALKNLFCACQRKARYFLAQLLTRTVNLLIDIRRRSDLYFIRFTARDIFGFINNLIGAFLRLID